MKTQVSSNWYFYDQNTKVFVNVFLLQGHKIFRAYFNEKKNNNLKLMLQRKQFKHFGI